MPSRKEFVFFGFWQTGKSNVNVAMLVSQEDGWDINFNKTIVYTHEVLYKKH